MKFSELDHRQQKAYKNIYHAANDYIGGLENTISDNEDDSEENIKATACLNDHAGLVETIYQEAITNLYDAGMVRFGKQIESHMKDIRFCGKEWLMARVEGRVKKLGY